MNIHLIIGADMIESRGTFPVLIPPEGKESVALSFLLEYKKYTTPTISIMAPKISSAIQMAEMVSEPNPP
jgi:hypothetical protein